MSIFTDHKVTRRALLLSTCGLVPGIRLFNALDTLGAPRRDYPVKPVPLTEVDILDDFWAPRMDVNRNVSIWHCFKKMKEYHMETRSEEHTSELQSRGHLVCRLLLEKKSAH